MADQPAPPPAEPPRWPDTLRPRATVGLDMRAVEVHVGYGGSGDLMAMRVDVTLRDGAVSCVLTGHYDDLSGLRDQLNAALAPIEGGVPAREGVTPPPDRPPRRKARWE